MDSLDLHEDIDSHVSLSPQDVQQMSTEGQLFIDSFSIDHITLKGEWVQGETVNEYTNFVAGDSVVSISKDIVTAGGVVII